MFVKVAFSVPDNRRIHVITPTVVRPTQRPDLTPLAQSLALVPNLHWIVVEDASQRTPFVTSLLSRLPFSHTHLLAASQKIEKKKARGVTPRNAGLKLLLDWADLTEHDVIYFADDDNSYDLRLFEQIRDTKRVSVFPVGFMRALPFSTPVVRNGSVVDFLDHFPAKRTFQLDMAGFAVNAHFWRSRGAPMFVVRQVGYLEDDFLRALKVNVSHLEPLADNCTKILVWHTKTTAGQAWTGPTLSKAKTNYPDSNVASLVLQYL